MTASSLQKEPTLERQSSFQEIDITSVVESASNPRRHFDERKLLELADSIRRQGLIEPVLVRWVKNRHELVVGARRLRAAKLAGLANIPARIVTLTDQQVLEIQVVENAQREDVHPLEEAEGFAKLLKFEGYTVDLIAEKVGKDPSYIYKRLHLAQLIEPLKEAFYDRKLQLSHALMLCRIPADKQKEVEERELWETRYDRETNKQVILGAISAASLNDWIHRHVLLSLSAAPWKKDDADLVAAAGSCIACPKRSGANLALFGDLKKGDDRCLDEGCYDRKGKAFIAAKEKEFAAAGKKLLRVATNHLSYGHWKKVKLDLKHDDFRVVDPKHRCEHEEAAIVAYGDHAFAQLLTICRSKACKVHYGRSSSGQYGTPKTAAEIWADKRKRADETIERETSRELLRLISTPREMSSVELQLIGIRLLERIGHDCQRELCTALSIEVKKGQYSTDYESPLEELLTTHLKGDPDYATGLLLAIATVNPFSPSSITKTAKELGVDVAAARKRIAQPILEKFNQAKARAAKALKQAVKKSVPKKGVQP